MDQNRTSSDSTQCRHTPTEEEGNTKAPLMAASTPGVTPFIHPLMIPQFNPLYYWHYPHPMIYPFTQFPISPQPYFLCPFPAAAWYYFNQPMMSAGPLYTQPMPFGVPPSVISQSPIAQSTNTGPATSITNNFVTHNEIGNDNSTNLKIHKNGTLSSSCYSTNLHSPTFAIGYRNTN